MVYKPFFYKRQTGFSTSLKLTVNEFFAVALLYTTVYKALFKRQSLSYLESVNPL